MNVHGALVADPGVSGMIFEESHHQGVPAVEHAVERLFVVFEVSQWNDRTSLRRNSTG